MDVEKLRRVLARPRGCYEILPLGMDCSVSYGLRKRNVRRQAFPFDWVVTPMQAVLVLLEDDFRFFLDPDGLHFFPAEQRMLFNEENGDLQVSETFITPVVSRRHGILFPHDFSERGETELDQVASRYHKRIGRLRALLAGGQTVVFAAFNGSPNDWQADKLAAAGVPFGRCFEGWEERLAVLLARRHPGLDYVCADRDSLFGLLQAART